MNNTVLPTDKTDENILEGGISPNDSPDIGIAVPGLQQKKLRVVLVSIAASGHFEPIKQIAEALKERGHEVIIVTNGGDERFVKNTKSKCEEMGYIMHYTDCGLSLEKDIMRPPTSSTELTYDTFQSKWEPFVKIKLQEIKPDVVVSDYVSGCGAVLAKQMGIPCLVNYTFPLEQFKLDGHDVVSMKDACSCCGMICLCRTTMQAFTKFYHKTMPYYHQLGVHQYDYVWMISGFYGLEDPVCLPTNVHLVGPMIPQDAPYMDRLQSKDKALYDWLEEAAAKKEDVVLISLGSICKLQSWSAQALFKGLDNLGCRVVWSLKDETLNLLDEQQKKNPKFWLSGWIPQIEVLHHRALKAGLTHCGWGGTLEFIGAGLPAVAFPHFLDQFTNTKLLCGKEAAVELHNKEQHTLDLTILRSYVQPAFDEKKVEEVFRKVLTDPKYKRNMQILQVQARVTNGKGRVVELVEQAYYTKNEHILDPDYKRKFNCQSWWLTNCFILFMLGIFAGFIVMLVLQFVE